MSLAGAGVEKEDVSSDASQARTPEDPVVSVGAPGDKIGTSIRPETVKAEVEIAQKVEPEIAAQAQADLDEEKAENDAAEQQAEQDLAVQQSRRSDEQKRQDASLQAALNKLRKDETPEQHAQRLKDEEAARLKAQKESPGIAQKLGHDAAEVAQGKLEKIEAKAQAELDKEQADEDALEHQAEEDKKANEAHQAEVQKKHQADEKRASVEATMFTKPGEVNEHLARISQKFEEEKKKTDAKASGRVRKTAAQIEEKANKADDEVVLPEVSKSNVTALVTQFQNKKEEAKPVATEPRRSGRISAMVKEQEAQQKAPAREIKVKAPVRKSKKR